MSQDGVVIMCEHQHMMQSCRMLVEDLAVRLLIPVLCVFSVYVYCGGGSMYGRVSEHFNTVIINFPLYLRKFTFLQCGFCVTKVV